MYTAQRFRVRKVGAVATIEMAGRILGWQKNEKNEREKRERKTTPRETELSGIESHIHLCVATYT